MVDGYFQATRSEMVVGSFRQVVCECVEASNEIIDFRPEEALEVELGALDIEILKY